MKHDGAFIISHSGVKLHRDTNKGWEIFIQWKDGLSSWGTLKDVKSYHFVLIAEYAHQKRILEDPKFL